MLDDSSSVADPKVRTRIVAIAEQALGRIVSSGHLPDPVTFAVWFAYVAETHPGLRRDVDALIAAGGLTVEAIRSVHDRHLVPDRASHRLSGAGDRLQAEAGVVGTIIEAAQSSVALYGADLDVASRRLGRSDADPPFDVVVAELVASTDRMRRMNRHLRGELARSEQQVSALQQEIEAIQADSLTDTVTAIGNRKQFERTLARLVEIAERTGSPLALALVDVDRFKGFNDQFGHQIGDDVLRLVAGVISRHIRDTDVVARYGGDEFAVLFPDTEGDDAVQVSERVRAAVAGKELIRRSSQENLGVISVSIGVAVHARGAGPDTIVRDADQHLLTAKRQGRNCVVG